MRLEIGKINITDIRFAEESKIEKGVLFINPETLKPVVLEDEKIKDEQEHRPEQSDSAGIGLGGDSIFNLPDTTVIR